MIFMISSWKKNMMNTMILGGSPKDSFVRQNIALEGRILAAFVY